MRGRLRRLGFDTDEEGGQKSIDQSDWLITFRIVLYISRRKVMSYGYQRHRVLQKVIKIASVNSSNIVGYVLAYLVPESELRSIPIVISKLQNRATTQPCKDIMALQQGSPHAFLRKCLAL